MQVRQSGVLATGIRLVANVPRNLAQAPMRKQMKTSIRDAIPRFFKQKGILLRSTTDNA